MPVSLQGYCAADFAAVKDAMQTNFSKRGDLGASVSIVHQNETVVDLWGGYADESQSALWQQHSIVNVFSTTKTMAALCLLMLHDRGKLDLFQPVCRYWPEFAEQGKKDILIAHIMSHSAGLSGLDQQVTESDLYSQDKMAGNLQEQKPWWQPGQACGYHSVTQGFLQAELVRRVDGRTLGAFFQQEVAQPLEAEFFIGVPDEYLDAIIPLQTVVRGEGIDLSSDSMAARTFRSPSFSADWTTKREWQQAEMPAINGHGNARSVAQIQYALANKGVAANGYRLLSEKTTELIYTPYIEGKDLVLRTHCVYGMGYGITGEHAPMSPNAKTAFWGGWGGSLVVVDAQAQLCISYVMNRMKPTLTGDTRGASIIRSTYACLKNLK